MKVSMRVESKNVKVHVNVVQLTLKVNNITDHSFSVHSKNCYIFVLALPFIKILFSLLINFWEAN